MAPFPFLTSRNPADASRFAHLVAEFSADRTLLSANVPFLTAVGHPPGALGELKDLQLVPSTREGEAALRSLWQEAQAGKPACGEFALRTKDGGELWLLASLTPVLDRTRRLRRVELTGFDITAQRKRSEEDRAKLAAASRAQAIIEFSVDGTILTANDNFLGALGYGLEEVQGQHHRMFVPADERNAASYQDFWSRLRSGSFVASEFRRVGKGGREVFIQASYNPIFDHAGQVVKVVKFATDVTDRVIAVRRLEEALGALAEGNLGHRIDGAFTPGLEPLRRSFNASLDQLDATMTSVVRSVRSMRSGLGEIASAAQDLAHRTEQQAASLEQSVAAISEIADGAKRAAQTADEVKQAAGVADEEGRRGNDTVGRAVQGMTDVEQSSQKIERIIGVIDEIAFQTNLLALNAGVEAARAGEAGRGFAVVAQEVRGLAQRSAEAAKEIKQLIAMSVQHVGEGVGLVRATGRSFEKMADHIGGVSSLISDMAARAREQSIGLGEVATAADAMDKVTQQNAAMVEETTAAVQNLLDETQTLSATVGRFRTSAGASSRERDPVPSGRANHRAPLAAQAGGRGRAAAAAAAVSGWPAND